MSTENDADGFDEARVARFVENHPGVSTVETLAQLGISPDHREAVASIVGDGDAGGDHADTEDDEPTESSIELDAEAIREHYRRARPVYEALGDVCGFPTLAIADNYGWYRKRSNDRPESADQWPRVGRCMTFDRDYGHLLERVGRTLYATTSYNEPEYLARWYECRFTDQGTEWRGDGEAKPTPDAEHTRIVSAWGDIDLRDDLKEKRGELTDEQRETIEATLAAYCEEFGELYGDRDAVYALDSVGGAYIFGAPEVTLPIGQIFNGDQDAVGRVIEEFIDRTNRMAGGR